MLEPQKARYDKAGPSVAAAFNKRHFKAYYAQDKAAAAQLVLSLIPQQVQHRVSWGGTMTMEQLGLKTKLEEHGCTLIDRDVAVTPEERQQLQKAALTCDTFIMSANAISEDGQLVNIDGNGNRVAALCYGPSSVIVIAGMNKVCPDLDDAIKRARSIAAPSNTQRFAGLSTPCLKTGVCGNCVNPDCCCSQIVITRMDRGCGRIKVILVGENLGL